MRKGRDWGVILSAVGLAGAALLLGAAVTRATLRTPVTAAPASAAVPAAESPTAEPSPAVRVASQELPGEVLSLAVERAPFDPDRQAPGQRYLMPGERVVREPVRVERPEPPPAPDFRVLGTVAGANGGVAVLQVEDGAPRVVAMGSEIMGYRVASIDGGRVVMSGQGRNLSLEVPDAVPSAAAVANNQRGQNGRAGQQGGRAGQQNTRNQNQQRDAERAQQQVQTRIQQIMEQARQGGGEVQVEMQGDRAFITTNGQRREIQIPEGVGRVQIGPQGNVTFQRGRGPGGGGE